MSEADDIESLRETMDSKADPAAVSIALAGGATTLDPHAVAYLERHRRLLDLQIENLQKQDRYELSHLRWRRFNDQMRGALQIVAFLISAAFVAAIGTLLWQAHEARGLVAEPLKTPPDFAARGLDGTVLSQQLLDKLNRIVVEANQYDLRKPSSIAGSWRDQSNVQIPNTGISFDELSRLLRGWLGHETKVSGEVYRTATGIAVTVRAGNNPGTTFTGREFDLDALLEKSARSLFKQVQIFSYGALFGFTHQEDPDTVAVAKRFAETGPEDERAYSYLAWGIALLERGDFRGALAPTDEAIRLGAANDPFPAYQRFDVDEALGHDEAALQDDETNVRLLSGPAAGETMRSDALAEAIPQGQAMLAELKGAFLDASALQSIAGQSSFDAYDQIAALTIARDLALAHDPRAAKAALASYPQHVDALAIRGFLPLGTATLPAFEIQAEQGDWKQAAADLADVDHAVLSLPDVTYLRHTFVWPRLAYAEARLGNQKTAEALIAITPTDCDVCIEMRGRIAEAGHKFETAAYWFARAIRSAPHLPFAATDWGAMLMRRGAYGGAIAKLELAHGSGPHFADPLELWGEALMEKNRSDLALAKFEEANTYAPRWGRLHLKWGEALFYAGRRDEAKAQFAVARELDMSTADRARLEPWSGAGGKGASR